VATTNYLVQNNIIEAVNARSKQLFKGLRKIQSDVNNGGWLIAEIRGVGVSVLTLKFVWISKSSKRD
jgi:4-aminobutyrate aminotransferase-like enzyme